MRRVKGKVRLIGMDLSKSTGSIAEFEPYDEVTASIDPNLRVYRWYWRRPSQPCPDGPHFLFEKIDLELLRRCVSGNEVIFLHAKDDTSYLGEMKTLLGYPYTDNWTYLIEDVTIEGAKRMFDYEFRLHGSFGRHHCFGKERDDHPTGFVIELQLSKADLKNGIKD